VLDEARPVDENPLYAADLPMPEPGTGQIRVRVHVCGVCHTDLHEVEGELDVPGGLSGVERLRPVAPGHQIVGRVDRLGPGVTRHKLGQRVGVPWLHSSCGQCRYCLRGQENLCQAARFTGYHVHGGYAEYTVVGQDFAYPIPTVFSDTEAAPLLCAGIIGFRSLRLAGVQPPSSQSTHPQSTRPQSTRPQSTPPPILGLYGFGAAAHICLQIARHWGWEVFVFTRSPGHRDLARALGAVWVGGAEDQAPTLLDSAIIFAPAGRLVPEALRALDKGGTLALGGIHMSDIPHMPYALLYHERTVRSVANSTREDAQGLLRVAAEIPIRATVQTFALHEANRALHMLKHSQLDASGVLEISH